MPRTQKNGAMIFGLTKSVTNAKLTVMVLVGWAVQSGLLEVQQQLEEPKAIAIAEAEAEVAVAVVVVVVAEGVAVIPEMQMDQ